SSQEIRGAIRRITACAWLLCAVHRTDSAGEEKKEKSSTRNEAEIRIDDCLIEQCFCLRSTTRRCGPSSAVTSGCSAERSCLVLGRNRQRRLALAHGCRTERGLWLSHAQSRRT